MPTLNVKKQALFKALGQEYTVEEFNELCFSYGLELDEVVIEINDNVEEEIYKIDIPANRYDLLCLEGLSTALLVFQNKLSIPQLKIRSPTRPVSIFVRPNVMDVRPHIVAAVLRDVTFTPERYASFIDLQDKLHQNICRKRTLVAIGTHDLDSIKLPIIYSAKAPSNIKFRALNQDKEYTATELMELYENHAQLKQYLHILKDKPLYPVLIDSEKVVLSLPPIINGYHSRISLKTKNVLIECTATDLTKAIIVLETLLFTFSQYCGEKFTAESCSIVGYGEEDIIYPKFDYRNKQVNVREINKYLGIRLDNNEMIGLLNRMYLKSEIIAEPEGKLNVTIPPFRSDIMHNCDIIEDVAIAYGYNNIVKTVPNISLVAKQFPLNKLTEQLREHIAFNGFIEALTFSLCSMDDIGRKLGKDLNNLPAVYISNPKTLEFEVARTSLLPGLLKTISSNKQLPLPLKLFEVSDVVLKDKNAGVGARNERHIGAIYYGKTTGFEIIHGLLDRIMQMLEIPRDVQNGYSLKIAKDETYFPERCAHVLYKNSPIGIIGVLHPDVLTSFDLTLPCSTLQINMEPFVYLP